MLMSSSEGTRQSRTVATQCDLRCPLSLSPRLRDGDPQRDELLMLLEEASRTTARGIGFLTEPHMTRETYSVVDGAALPSNEQQVDDNPFGPQFLADAAVFHDTCEFDGTPSLSDRAENDCPRMDESPDGEAHGRAFVPQLPLKGMRNASSNCSLGSWAYVYTPRSPTTQQQVPPLAPRAAHDGLSIRSAVSESTFPWSLQSSPLSRTVMDSSRRPSATAAWAPHSSEVPDGLCAQAITQRKLLTISDRTTPPNTPAVQRAPHTPPRHPHSRQGPTPPSSGSESSPRFPCPLFVEAVEAPREPYRECHRGVRSAWMLREALSRMLFRNACLASLRLVVIDLADYASAWMAKQPAQKKVVATCKGALHSLSDVVETTAKQISAATRQSVRNVAHRCSTVMSNVYALCGSWSPMGGVLIPF